MGVERGAMNYIAQHVAEAEIERYARALDEERPLPAFWMDMRHRPRRKVFPVHQMNQAMNQSPEHSDMLDNQSSLDQNPLLAYALHDPITCNIANCRFCR